jgi:hypothetical protein
MCFKYIKIYNKWKSFEKHRKIKEDIYNKRFPVRDIFVNFLFGFGLHFLSTTHINTGSSAPGVPSKSRDLADENNKILTEWKWFETTVLDQRWNYLLSVVHTTTHCRFYREQHWAPNLLKPVLTVHTTNTEYQSRLNIVVKGHLDATKSTQNKTEVQTWRTNTWSENKNSGNTKSNNRKWDQVFRNGYHLSSNQLHPPWSKLRRGIRGYGVSCHF